MAWSMISTPAADKLTRIKGWEIKGINYWVNRYNSYQKKVVEADNSGTLGRALVQRDIALAAINQLRK